MSPAGRLRKSNAFWSVALLAVAFAELALQEAYFRISASSLGLLVLLTSAVVVAAADWLVRRFAQARLVDLLQRLLFLSSALVAGYWLFNPHFAGLWDNKSYGVGLPL